MDRIVREPVGVVRIRMAAREPEDAVGQQMLLPDNPMRVMCARRQPARGQSVNSDG